MIAMVLCAGLGTRLRPLTYELPKPMMPLVGMPTLHYTLTNLERQGFKEVIINISYKADEIEKFFGDGRKWGMKIHWSKEPEPLGTAGGVKKVESIIKSDPDDDFLITSGDGLTDLNFQELIAFHKKKKSIGTIALKHVDSKMEYGVVVAGESGRIERFVEKPAWSSVLSPWVNTGIYVFNKAVLDMIPKNKMYDFGKELWPRLVEEKKAIFGYRFDNFWTDIGSLEEYKQAQQALLAGKLKFNLQGREVRPQIWVGKNSRVHPSVKLQAPCWIGENCVLEKNATMAAHSVLGSNSRLKTKSVVGNSILWNHTVVESGVKVFDSVVGSRCKVPRSTPFLQGYLLNSKTSAQI